MSLLLDALKKAAEKKAKKDAESAAQDKTESVTRTQLTDDATVVDRTVSDKTVAMTQTELDTTRVDATHLDATHIDATHVDSTGHDKTTTDTTIKIDSTQIDATLVNHPHQETTQELDIRGLDLAKLAAEQKAAEEQKQSVLTDDDETYLDPEGLAANLLKASESDPGQPHRASTDSKVKTDTAQPDVTQKHRSAAESTQELDVSKLDLSQLADTENEIIFDSGHDETLSFIDEDVEIEDEGEDQTLVLTPDDITEFLGSGNYPKKSTRQPVVPPPVRYESSDDTTITNSESLSLTNIETDDMDLEPMPDQGYPLAQDSTRTDAAHYRPRAGRAFQPDQGTASSFSNEADQPTMANVADNTSSSIDIEKLTNDETVTIKDGTFTRTFAPDNYDRTLMKLADNDVSRIFPGMRSETDAVMTPDYAKKVFLSKSRGVKNYYYKVYAGIALCILLVVVVWGMFEIQSESESIDNNLVALKRDPMPGIIKPKDQPEPVNLFTTTPQVDNQAIKLIEKADTENTGIAGESQAVDSGVLSDAEVVATTQSTPAEATASPATNQVQNASSEKAQPVPVKKPVASAQPKQAALQLSSNNRVSKKDQLLAEAFAAYEAGDLDKARKQYQQVIALDPENRDALLGRAAIHVFDNQFENAIIIYQKLLLANPKDDLAMTSLISVANVDPKTGETEIKRLLNELPDSPYLHFALGNMFGNQNRWSEAQTQYFKALQYRPTDPNYAYNMAISLEHLEKPASAITFYKRALENKSNGLTTFSESVVMQRIEVLAQ